MILLELLDLTILDVNRPVGLGMSQKMPKPCCQGPLQPRSYAVIPQLCWLAPNGLLRSFDCTDPTLPQPLPRHMVFSIYIPKNWAHRKSLQHAEPLPIYWKETRGFATWSELFNFSELRGIKMGSMPKFNTQYT